MLWSVFLLPRFLPQLAETRRDFVRIGEDLETAVIKNAQVSRHKAGDAERTSHLLLATRKCYQHFALDYCLQVGRRILTPLILWSDYFHNFQCLTFCFLPSLFFS